MGNLIIRRAVSSDVEKIVELRLLLQEHCEESNPSIWRITEEGEKLLRHKVENDIMDSSIVSLVAEVKGEVIGFIQGESTQRSEYLPSSVGSISVAYVMKGSRRKGVGKRLVKELSKFFESKGVEHITLRYIIGNEEAEQFWKKLGFEPIITTAGTHLENLESKLKTLHTKAD